MTTTARRRWFAALALFIVLLFAAFLWARPLLNIGAGYAAKHACSCHFLQGRALEEIREHDLNFSVLGYVSLSVEAAEVHSSFFGLVPRRAVYREGSGCTLINDERKPLAKLDSGAAAGAGAGGRSRDSVALQDDLDAALDYGMQPVAGGGARGIVIMQGGVIVGERYADGYDSNSLLLGWSMTKTLTGMALGAYKPLPPGSTYAADLQQTVNRKNLYPEWAGDARSNIKLADLMHMNSGLGWNEAYGAISDATIMLHEQADMSAYAAGMPAVEPPNELWSYSSGTTNILVDLLDRDLAEATAYDVMNSIFRPVAPSLLIEPDQTGQPVGSSYGWATARDWARLGQFMLQDGVWEGDTLLQPGWVDFMREPAAGSDGNYGGQLWLPGPDVPSLPEDAFLMRGFQDQRVFIIPSRNLVITRLGHNEDKATDFDGLLSRVLEAL